MVAIDAVGNNIVYSFVTIYYCNYYIYFIIITLYLIVYSILIRLCLIQCIHY